MVTGRKVATYPCDKYVTDSQLVAKNKNDLDGIIKAYTNRPVQLTLVMFRSYLSQTDDFLKSSSSFLPRLPTKKQPNHIISSIVDKAYFDGDNIAYMFYVRQIGLL